MVKACIYSMGTNVSSRARKHFEDNSSYTSWISCPCVSCAICGDKMKRDGAFLILSTSSELKPQNFLRHMRSHHRSFHFPFPRPFRHSFPLSQLRFHAKITSWSIGSIPLPLYLCNIKLTKLH